MMELAGTTAFITGGGGGIGEGLAEAFVEQGMNVVLADINADAAAVQAAKYGAAAIGLQLDVTSPASWDRAKLAALGRFGQVDVLCNNAGISLAWQPLIDVTPDDFARVFQVNTFSIHHGVRAFGPDMIARRRGHILNTSSFNGLISHGTMGPYSASKFAVTALTVALREEMAPHGIGVTAIYPGATRSLMSAEMFARHPDVIRKQRLMEPVWIGRAAVAAIRKNEPHIISHPALKPAYDSWVDEVLAAFREPAEPGYGA